MNDQQQFEEAYCTQHAAQAAEYSNVTEPEQATQPQVNLASYSYVHGPPEPAWYLDSGATNHVTSQLDNLSIKSNYKGKAKLAVGNGSLLTISHIGDSVLHVPSSHSHLKLNNILHVPSITKNLLSISQFTRENHVVIEFNCDACLIKDRRDGRVLMSGAVRDGLYPLSLSSFKQTPSQASPKSVPLKPVVCTSHLDKSKLLCTESLNKCCSCNCCKQVKNVSHVLEMSASHQS